MRDNTLTPRRQLLAAVVIGALALAGSIGARQAARGVCPPTSGARIPGVPIAPLDLDDPAPAAEADQPIPGPSVAPGLP